jgi:formate hydrogenlyase subunit 3/multisubunit Na+/H+ antiporter MnhD subunit
MISSNFLNIFLLDKNYLILFAIFFFGLFYSLANLSKISFFNFLKPPIFAILGFFCFQINSYNNENLLNGIMIIGITLSFIISSIISLREKYQKKLDFLIFIYYGLLIVLFNQTFIQKCNLFHLITIIEILSIVGFVFLIVDYENSKIDLKVTNEILEKQNSKKNISMRYLITHCFSGLFFILGIIGMITNGSSISLNDFFNGKSHINYFIVISILINIAIPFFSFWFVQSYSSVRFSFSIIMMSGVSKISLFLLFFISKNHQIPYLEVIGIVTMIYGSFMTLQEINIRRFFCYSLISHNGFLILAISQKLTNNLFIELISISFILQILFASFIFLVSYNSKEYYFSEIEKNIKKYKFLFFLSVLVNWFFISMPYTIGFFSKSVILNEIKIHWIKNGFYWTILTNIFAHLFVFNYRLFSKQNLIFNTSFSKNDYIKNITIFIISTIPIFLLYIFIYKNNILPNFDIFLKYLSFLLISGVSFLLFKNFFTKNQFLPYDITTLFEYLKQLLNLLFYILREFQNYFEQYFEKLKEKIFEIPSYKKYLNSYHFLMIFFFSCLCFLITKI